MTFFTGESNIMIEELKEWFEKKKKKTFLKTSYLLISFLQTHRFSLYKLLTDGLESCGLLVYYYDVFISYLDSHSDGTHSPQRIYK